MSARILPNLGNRRLKTNGCIYGLNPRPVEAMTSWSDKSVDRLNAATSSKVGSPMTCYE
jgi:hypothetical protein